MTWGLPVAWFANAGLSHGLWILALFFGGVCWTIHYDTIYACQDRVDDVKAGVRSTAVLFGDNIRWILAFFSTMFVISLAYAGLKNGNGPLYFVLTVAGTAVHLTWQLSVVDFDSGADCWRMFKANGDLGYLIWAGMLCDYCYRVLPVGARPS